MWPKLVYFVKLEPYIILKEKTLDAGERSSFLIKAMKNQDF